MAFVERSVYDKDADKYVVGRMISRDVSDSVRGPKLYFRDACTVPKRDVEGRDLVTAVTEAYSRLPHENLHFFESSFANKRSVATIRVPVE